MADRWVRLDISDAASAWSALNLVRVAIARGEIADADVEDVRARAAVFGAIESDDFVVY